MQVKLAVIMDPIEGIRFETDGSFDLMIKAQKRGWKVYYLQQENIFLRGDQVFAQAQQLKLFEDEHHYVEKQAIETISLTDMDIVLMRKDPPVNQHYIYTTQLLSLLEKHGVLVANNPQAIRDYNEKLVISLFPDLIAPTIVSSQASIIKDFIAEQKEVIVKPLHGLGGLNVFYLKQHDMNTTSLIEMMTEKQKTPVMVQKFLPVVTQGDKRIFMIDGEVMPKMLVRMPKEHEVRSNMASGGSATVQELTNKEKKLCQRLSPFLKENNLYFVGLDMIGDYLTEINVTCPTGIRYTERLDPSCHFSDKLLDVLFARCRLSC